MKSTILLPTLFLSLLFWGACTDKLVQNAENTDDSTLRIKSLQTEFASNFHIGAALGRVHILDQIPEARVLIEREFNTITPENDMKWENIHPTIDSFHFSIADKFVDLGRKQDMFVVGHTLVWHSQLASWVEEIKDAAEMEMQLKNHIQTIVTRYKGRINGWDVVNEALNEDGTLRKSIFLEVMGESYLQKAFQWASEADPEAELYYNDYNMTKASKRKGAIEMIKKIQASGTKIDGVGLQAHWGFGGPSLEEIERSILEYAELGLKVMFTEMDINVLPNPWDIEGADVNQSAEGNEMMNPYTAGLPDSVEVKQAQRYADIFRLLLKHQDKISRVTFWGVNDGHSWKNNWPIRGRTDYPLLHDRDFQPKAAYDSIMAIKMKANAMNYN